MAYETHPTLGETLIAGADLSTKRNHLVKISSANDATKGRLVLAGAGDLCFPLTNAPANGDAGSVKWGGIATVICGGAITAGNQLAADASGQAKVAVAARVNTSDAGAAEDPGIGSYVFGVALEDGIQNQIISVLMLNAGLVATTAA